MCPLLTTSTVTVLRGVAFSLLLLPPLEKVTTTGSVRLGLGKAGDVFPGFSSWQFVPKEPKCPIFAQSFLKYLTGAPTCVSVGSKTSSASTHIIFLLIVFVIYFDSSKLKLFSKF